MVMKNVYKGAEHPFAPYVRILGKGRTGSRSLSFEEARDAMGMVLRGEVLEVQLGAFLMLLRVKEETPEELAGFVAAARDFMAAPRDIAVDLDWSSYAGKRKHYPWFLFAVKLLVANGVRVFMHGASGHTVNRLYTENVLPVLGMPVCEDWAGVRAALDTQRFAYLPLEKFCPPLGEMIALRNVMGLRSPVHTLARLLNPLDAPFVMQAIFHPAYRESHQSAAALLGYRNSCVIKGEGGEIERNPDGLCLAKRIVDGALQDEEWPMLFPLRHAPEEEFVMDDFLAVWRGEKAHEYGEMAVVATVALALRTLQRADSQDAAMAMARAWWEARDRHAPASPR
ncbi:MAG: glycosyl transferase family protein [Moraxellaceae bacterium]|jgi:anthranilate phosphoribosyltransferase|nr:glycosyl transferase family protein [Moraxellaceae bacterium]